MTETAATSSGTSGASGAAGPSGGSSVGSSAHERGTASGRASVSEPEVQASGGDYHAAGETPSGPDPDLDAGTRDAADLHSGADADPAGPGGPGSLEPERLDGGAAVDPESVAVGRASVPAEAAPLGFRPGAPDPTSPAPRVTPSVPDQAGSADLFTPAQERDRGSRGEHPTFTRVPGMPPPPDRLEDVASPDGHPDAYRLPTVGYSPAPATMGLTTSGFLGSQIAVSAPPAGSFSGTAAPPTSTRATGRAGTTGITVRPIGTGAAVGAARVTETARPPRVSPPVARGPRRARLSVKRVDPWSVMKFSFAVSLVLFIVVIVAAAVLYLALDAMGVFSSINTTLADLIESNAGSSAPQITARAVIGTSALLGAVNVVLFTALATLGAFIYNVCADLVGGIEVTLSERD